MSETFRAGAKGEPLPSSENVMRLLRNSLEGRAKDVDFELSSGDKDTSLQAYCAHLVWTRISTRSYAQNSRC